MKEWIKLKIMVMLIFWKKSWYYVKLIFENWKCDRILYIQIFGHSEILQVNSLEHIERHAYIN